MISESLLPVFVSRAVCVEENIRSPVWEAFVFSQRSPDKKSVNEDAALIFPIDSDHFVCAVADGCGGMREGERASQLALQTLSSHLTEAQSNSASVRHAIIDAIEAANQEILKLDLGAGCTIAVAEIRERMVRSYHAGDSVVAVVDADHCRYESVCHSPVGYAVESGLLRSRKAMFHSDRHLVSNMLGHKQMKIELGPEIRLLDDDTVLVASDGLFDNLSMREIVQRVGKAPLETCVQKLTKLASRRMDTDYPTRPSKPDDLTIIAARLA